MIIEGIQREYRIFIGDQRYPRIVHPFFFQSCDFPICISLVLTTFVAEASSQLNCTPFGFMTSFLFSFHNFVFFYDFITNFFFLVGLNSNSSSGPAMFLRKSKKMLQMKCSVLRHSSDHQYWRTPTIKLSSTIFSLISFNDFEFYLKGMNGNVDDV